MLLQYCALCYTYITLPVFHFLMLLPCLLFNPALPRFNLCYLIPLFDCNIYVNYPILQLSCLCYLIPSFNYHIYVIPYHAQTLCVI